MICNSPTLVGIFNVALCILLLVCIPVEASQTVLLRKLMKDYNKEIRPVINNEPTKVVLNVAVIKIILVEEKLEAFTSNVWISMYWTDTRLSWNKTEYGLDIITVRPETVWVPDITLLNRAEGSETIASIETRVQSSYEGNVTWMLQAIYKSSCSIDITYFPFDDQVCPLKIGSWTYNTNQLQIIPKDPTADLDNYQVNGEWTLLSAKAHGMSKKYSYSDSEYSAVQYDISVRRETLYYVMNFIVPCMLIAILTVPVLLLPPESQEKQSYGVTVLLSFTILIMMLQAKVPPTSKVFPMIAIYYACSIVEVSLAMGMSTVMLCFYHKRPRTIPVPKWVKVIVLTWCAKLVRLHDSVDKVKAKLYATMWKKVSLRKSRGESSGIKDIMERVFDQQEQSIRQEEWRIAAYVVNRLFAWIYVFTILLTFVLVFFKAPRTKEGTL